MSAIQNALRTIVTITGFIVILAPVVSVLLTSKRGRGRTTGTNSSFRRWPVVILVTIGFLAVGFFLWKPLPLSMPVVIRYLLTWSGFLIYIPAICLYLWGFLTLGKYFRVSTTSGADLFLGHQLIKNGPYRFMRHPMYLAVILAAIGAFLVFLTWAMILFFPMSFVVIFRASQEEKLLESEFGDAWREYAKRVPGWFPRWFGNKGAI